MKMYQKLALVVWLIVTTFGLYGILTREDTVIDKLKSWSSESRFEVKRLYPDELSVLPKGNLGVFHKCLTMYVSDGYRGGYLPSTGNAERVIIKLEDNTELDLSVNSTEVLSFVIIPHDLYGSAIGSSNVYKVSCDIRLLNKPESDMYCEDKLIGNLIRPVCTYRPQPQLSQDNSKG